jgi:starch synthase
MKVLYLAAECKPFAKVGGVGDVAGELPLALKDSGVEIEIVLPLYESVDRKHVGNEYKKFSFDYAGQRAEATVYRGSLRDVPVFFVSNAYFFEGDYGKPYIFSEPTPYLDDIKRFSFFSEAALHLVEDRQPDVVHINDWPLAYLFGRMVQRKLPQRRVLTIHNVGYQGNLFSEFAQDLHISLLCEDSKLRPLFEDPRPHWKSVNALRLALELADAANTVSPTYCREMTLPENGEAFFEGGKGLEAVASRLVGEGRLCGILNGFVYDKPKPTRPHFRALLTKKDEAKKRLGSRFLRSDNFLLGFVGRAVEQKFRLLVEHLDGRSILEHILAIPGVNVAILATGLSEYESFLAGIAKERLAGDLAYDQWLNVPRRQNYAPMIAFDRDLAGAVSLGSDVFLMPSLFEPCGITQLESMSQATPPLVRETGGLADTVKPHTGPQGTGFCFSGSSRSAVLEALLGRVHEAMCYWRQRRDEFEDLQWRAYRQRFTWEEAAQEYKKKLYESSSGSP